MMRAVTPTERFKQYIWQARQDLSEYAKRDNANEAFINRRNRNLQELTEIFNSIAVNNLHFVEYWIKAEGALQNVIGQPEISGVYLYLELREQGTPAYFNLNSI